MGFMTLFKSGQDTQTTPRKPGVFASLDVGAAKTVCFIAKTEQTLAGLRPRVIGVGHAPSKGVRAGAIVDMEAAAEGVRTAVKNAEAMAKQTISEVTLATSVGGVSGERIAVDMDLAGSEVTDRDLRRILAEAVRQHDAPGRVLLHALTQSWRVDGHTRVQDPRAMMGETLGVQLHMVSTSADPLQNLIACVERCQLTVAGVAATPFATGLAALAEDERALGALVIDLGAQTTSCAAFVEGDLQYLDAVPVGGAHVTADIARGLSTSIQSAERIKVLHGCALDSPDDDRVMIDVPPVAASEELGMTQQPRALLNAIIRPRLEETFELIRDRLDAAGLRDATGRQLVLTGGGAQLPGTAELAGRILGKHARIGRPSTLAGLGDAVAGPAFSAAAGVLQRCVSGPSEAISGPPRFVARTSQRRIETTDRGPGAVWRWFAESF